MQDRTFDRLSRAFAEQSNRRGFLGGLGALVAAGFASTAFGHKRSFSRQFAAAADDSEEQSVLLFEELGRIAHEHDGTCDDMAGKVYAFQDQYGEDLLRFQAEQAAWPDDRRARHADTYGARRLVVVARINAVHERCQAMDASGTPGTPVATPIVAAPATPVASPVAVDKGHPTVRRAFAQVTPKCNQANYNFKPEAFCEKDGWTSPTFQWPAYCPSGTITQTCEMCLDDFNGVTFGDICPKYWPQDCVAADGSNLCQVNFNSGGGGVAGANCGQVHATATPQARCYSRKSDWHSPAFAWPALCPDVRIDHECILCTEDPGGDTNPDMCVKYWPQDCNSSSEGNICYIGWHVPEGTTCCEQNCPISTGDCALNGIGSFIGDYRCAGCMTSWCGSTDRCLEDCKIDDCCNGACAETTKSGLPFDDDDDDDDTTDFPGGEGRRGGTPIPIGTPDVTPTVVPPTEVPTEAPPPAVPTEAPSTPSIATPLT